MLLNHKEIFLVDVWSAEGRLQLRRWFGIGEPGEGNIGELGEGDTGEPEGGKPSWSVSLRLSKGQNFTADSCQSSVCYLKPDKILIKQFCLGDLSPQSLDSLRELQLAEVPKSFWKESESESSNWLRCPRVSEKKVKVRAPTGWGAQEFLRRKWKWELQQAEVPKSFWKES